MTNQENTTSVRTHLCKYRQNLQSLLVGTCFIVSTIYAANAKPHYDDIPYLELHAPVGSETIAPLGYRLMCADTPQLCLSYIGLNKKMPLSEARLEQLRTINLDANKSIKPMTDQELYGVVEKWTMPSWAGDCEDYVLMKRARLIEKGWPEEALLITVVKDLKGEGHAVLTVVTDKGDYILDNHTNSIRLWSETGYTFIKRQSQTASNRWVSLKKNDLAPDLATARNR